jgi:hypothetical protein
VKPHFSAIISAEMPWLNPCTPNRSSTLSEYGLPSRPAEPMGTRDIDSTPPATTKS